MNVTLAPEVTPLLAAGLVEAAGVTVRKDNPRWDVIDALCASLREEYHAATMAQIPDVDWARRLFSAVGIDPTKHRPSSEALLRRAVKGESLYQINTLVDAMNWCSLEFLLPIGLYDTDRIEGDVTLRLGGEGESYEGIGRGDIHLAGRLCAADDRGAFGSPISDSRRTMITEETRNALAVIFAPRDYPADDLAEAVEVMAERAQSWCGGEIARTDVLRG